MALEVSGLIQMEAHKAARRRLTIAYFAAFVGLGLTTGALGPTLPTLASQTNQSLSAISYSFTFRSLGYVLGSLTSGKLFDKDHGNHAMGLLMLIASITVCLIPLAPSLILMLVIMLALGVFEAGLDVGANTLLVRVHQTRVAPYMSAMHSCFGVGALLAPIIVAQLTLARFQSIDSYFVIGVILLPVSLFLLTLPKVQASDANRSAEEPRPRRTRIIIFALSLFLFLYVGAEVGFAGWIFTYAVTTKLGTAATAAYLTSLFWGSLTLGRALMIPAAARLRPETILTASLVGALLSLATMLVGTQTLLIITGATLGLGLSMASIFPATMSLAGTRTTITGRLTGWLVVGASLGATTIPLVIGQVFSERRASFALALPGLALLFATLLLVGLFMFERLSCTNKLPFKVQHREQATGC